ncbi:MAG: TetR/AcrR family transcriptional regulator, partial [Acinetobacter sp.]
NQALSLPTQKVQIDLKDLQIDQN